MEVIRLEKNPSMSSKGETTNGCLFTLSADTKKVIDAVLHALYTRDLTFRILLTS